MLRVVVVLVLASAVVSKVAYIKTKEEIQAFRMFLDQSQIPSATRHSSNVARFPLANTQENSGLFQGDILLTDEQKENLVQRFATGSRNGVISSGRRWPDKTVVYDIDESYFQARHIAAIEAAFDDLRGLSCVDFRKRNANDLNWVRVTGSAGGCYAHVGFYSGFGAHTLNLEVAEPPFGCFFHGVILHEFLHSLGFWHMHSTHDRDDWVEILWQNIAAGYESAFDRYDNTTVSNYGTEYDYGSIMHYSEYAFSANNQRTLMPKREYTGSIGFQERLSESDRLKLNRLYQCPGYESW